MHPEIPDALQKYAAKPGTKKVHENERKNWLQQKAEELFSVISAVTGNVSFVEEIEGRNTEVLSKAQRKAADNIVNMFGERGKDATTRAHLLPKNRACNIFWGMVSDALSGIDMSTFSEEKKIFVRSEMARILARFKLDLFAFATAHNSYYDLLEDGPCVMIVPLLTVEQIAKWKQGEKYEVLIFCSSKETYKKLGVWREDDNLNHMKWEDAGDLELAIDVLTAHVKALADSLNIHWGCYHSKVHSKHKDFSAKKEHMSKAHEDLRKNALQVEVPQKRKNLQPFGFRRKKLFKIDLGELYNENENKMIPDPSLFAYKAAVNWSGRNPETPLRKLLSCCSPEDESDEESYLSGPPSVTEIEERVAAYLGNHGGSDATQVASEYASGGRTGLHLLGREVALVVSNSDGDQSISDVSSDGDGWGAFEGATV